MILPQDNTQIFASQYQTVLPDRKQLIALLNEETDKTEETELQNNNL